MINTQVHFQPARLQDVDALVELENRSFDYDRMSARSFRHMIQKGNCDFILAWQKQQLLGYVLVLYHRGTHLARMYSLAVAPDARGMGLGDQLLKQAEALAEAKQCTYMRLEVHPKNAAAIRLYEKHGYYPFEQLEDYYEDHADALRYEKRILHLGKNADFIEAPYYQQSTEFSCGPASLIMAMQALDKNIVASRKLELQLWREATTIYMTSGHGGCGPHGLALAAWRRGFHAKVYVNTDQTLFLDGVRSEEKKTVMQLVHEDFMEQIREAKIPLRIQDTSITDLEKALRNGCVPLVLISTYRFNRNKAPHWVVVSGIDDTFVYIHDPEVDEETHRFSTDNIYLPIARSSFEKAFRFGASGLRTCVMISKN